MDEFSSEVSDNAITEIAMLAYNHRPEKIMNGMQAVPQQKVDNIPWEMNNVLKPRRHRTRKRRGNPQKTLTPSQMTRSTAQETERMYSLHGTALSLENITSQNHHHWNFPKLYHHKKGSLCNCDYYGQQVRNRCHHHHPWAGESLFTCCFAWYAITTSSQAEQPTQS